MDRVKLGKAAKLLAKAESTDFDPEAAALAERAYRLVAEVLNAFDEEANGQGGQPRRERRNLRERRASRKSSRSGGGRFNRSDAANSYRLRSEGAGPRTEDDYRGQIDLSA
jgi:Protein of unknown function (DUF2786)